MAASLPTIHGFPNFKYDPLDLSSKRPSIRLAILQPGIVGSTVRVTLAQSAFADRPRYEALSYTWGAPDAVKGIELNGMRVDIRQNLWLALVNLRDHRQERVLWIDAICINQMDLDERNHQVKLMAYIFSRAQEVLVWLGLINTIVPVNFEPHEEKQRQDEIVELCIKPYWKRVWIVQEIGAATQLRVQWGSGSATWDKFVERVRMSPTNVEMALKLANQREGRHGDSFLLANLIEVCQSSLCEEPRDKIYGFVGIAHDCQDDSLPVDYSKSLFEVYEDVIRFQYHWHKETKQALKENKKSIVHFSQLVQKVLGGSVEMNRDFALSHPGRTIKFPPPVEDVSHNFDPFKLPEITSGTISIASAAGDMSKNFDVFKVTGVYSGTISIVGPTYSDMVGDPEATKIWKSTLSKCHGDIEELRRKNEGFMRVLLDLNSRELAKVCAIETEFVWKREPDPPKADEASVKASMEAFNKLPRFKLAQENSDSSSLAFRVAGTKHKPGEFSWERPAEPIGVDGLKPSVKGSNKSPRFKLAHEPTEPSSLPPRSEEKIVEPRLFLTRKGVMGLVPPNVRGGDLIFQFWNSDTVAIVQKQHDHYLRIVGRAVVSNKVYKVDSKFHVPLDVSKDLVAPIDGFDFTEDGKDIYMDITTLQLLTQ